MTLHEHLKFFMDMLSTQRGFSPLSLSAYAADIRSFMETLPEPTLACVTQTACLQYLDKVYGQRLSDATVARRLSALNQFFGYLVAERHLSDNPLRLMDRPRFYRPLPQPLSADEVMQLLEAAHLLDQEPGQPVSLTLMLELFYATGMRVSELVSLKAGDYMPGKGVMVRGKGRKDRFIPLTPQAHRLLRLRIEQMQAQPFQGSPWVFGGTKPNAPLTRQRCALLLKSLALEAGVDPDRVYPHALRHAFATHMLEGGADLMSVQKLLGHADVATTEIYTHVTDRSVRKALEAAHPLMGKKN